MRGEMRGETWRDRNADVGPDQGLALRGHLHVRRREQVVASSTNRSSGRKSCVRRELLDLQWDAGRVRAMGAWCGQPSRHTLARPHRRHRASFLRLIQILTCLMIEKVLTRCAEGRAGAGRLGGTGDRGARQVRDERGAKGHNASRMINRKPLKVEAGDDKHGAAARSGPPRRLL